MYNIDRAQFENWLKNADLPVDTIVLIQSNLDRFTNKAQPIDLKRNPKTRIRHTGEETSFEAAISISPEKAARTFQAIIDAYTANGPMTDEELNDYLTDIGFVHSESGVRARRAELKDAGWVYKTTDKRLTRAGHRSIVWDAR